ncbi:hypothetical protein BASA61_004297 [Batrachochytrium salamandrivorans]|nr:hypothetical protein BASA62_007932 [Batrachochytrium salamandrivorans]KAH6593460.1 hypothetical protein BASA61_004297 [Batrachochytrium salamandrivorans]
MAHFGQTLADTFDDEDVTPERHTETSEGAVLPEKGDTAAPLPAAGSWGAFSWGGLVDVVKKQSEAVVQVYKRDLNEFVQTVAAEGSQGVSIITRNLQALGTSSQMADPITEPQSSAQQQHPTAAMETVHAISDAATVLPDPQATSQDSDRNEGDQQRKEEEEESIDAAPTPPVADTMAAAQLTAHPSVPTADPALSSQSSNPPSPSVESAMDLETDPIVQSQTAPPTESSTTDALLDKLDAMTEKAENYVGQQLSVLGSGFATGFSSLMKSVTQSMPSVASPLSRSMHTVPSTPPPVPACLKYNRVQAMVDEMSRDPSTFTTDPRDLVQVSSHMTSDPEAYVQRFIQFESSFDQISKAGQIAILLASHTHISSLFEDLVPLVVTDTDFWQRYYFRISEIEREEAARRLLVDQATTAGKDDDEDFIWDSDEDEEVLKENPKSPARPASNVTLNRVDKKVVGPIQSDTVVESAVLTERSGEPKAEAGVDCDDRDDRDDLPKLESLQPSSGLPDETIESRSDETSEAVPVGSTDEVDSVSGDLETTLAPSSAQATASPKNGLAVVICASSPSNRNSEDQSSDSFELVHGSSVGAISDGKPHDDLDGSRHGADTMLHSPEGLAAHSGEKEDWGGLGMN